MSLQWRGVNKRYQIGTRSTISFPRGQKLIYSELSSQITNKFYKTKQMWPSMEDTKTSKTLEVTSPLTKQSHTNQVSKKLRISWMNVMKASKHLYSSSNMRRENQIFRTGSLTQTIILEFGQPLLHQANSKSGV